MRLNGKWDMEEMNERLKQNFTYAIKRANDERKIIYAYTKL